MPVSNLSPARALGLAREALRVVPHEPHRAVTLANAALRAGARPEPDAVTVAWRALGLAAREQGDMRRALRCLRRAVTTAERSGCGELAAEARMSLALALAEAGRTGAALASAERAINELHGVARARALAQHAMIISRQGRTSEALVGYRRAIAVLRREGDAPWLARALTNRGLLHAYAGSLVQAELDLLEVETLASHAGLSQLRAATHHNLGFVAGRCGDVPAALGWFDRAARGYADLGLPRAVMLADLGDVLSTVRLIDEARAAAAQAVGELSCGGAALDLAEARLTLAHAALLDDDPPTARIEARAARTAFVRQKRQSWALYAAFVELRADGLDTRSLPGACRLAGELHKAGWKELAVDARILVAQTALVRGLTGVAARELAIAASRRHRGPLSVRARAWYAEALRRHAGLQRGRVESALEAGLAALDATRAALGATELRIHVAARGEDLIALGLQRALDAGDARRVLRWSERHKANALSLRPARPPDDPRLAEALAELRRTTAALEQAALDGGATVALDRRRTALEQAVCHRARHARGGLPVTTTTTDVREVAATLDNRALVAYSRAGTELFAVTVASRRWCVHRLGDARGVDADIASLRASLSRTARGSRLHTDASIAVAENCAASLERALIAPLGRPIAERPLVIVPTGTLHGLPWATLPALRDRPVSVTPSLLLWLGAERRPRPDAAGPVVLVTGPQLSEASREIDEVARRYPNAMRLSAADATTAVTLAALDGAALAHIAAHGSFRADNPLFSSLLLADGPLFIHDLERLNHPPTLLVLTSCEAGRSAVHPGDELVGLAAALLGLGTRTVVAPVLPVADTAARRLAVVLHDALRAGHDPSNALADARQRLARDDAGVVATANAFVCLGAG